jgi:hypothetical protein
MRGESGRWRWWQRLGKAEGPKIATLPGMSAIEVGRLDLRSFQLTSSGNSFVLDGARFSHF